MLKRFILFILIGIILSATINLLYERYCRPDNLFFSDCLKQSEKWEEEIRATQLPCYVFAGASDVRMGIDPETMWSEHQLPAINAGVQAGNGLMCNVQSAIPFLQANDTLVLSVMPGFGTTSSEYPHSGINFCFRHQGVQMFTDNLIDFNASTVWSIITGDATNYCIHLMRILTRPNNIYRYSTPGNAKINKGGRVEVFLTNEQHVQISHDAKNIAFQESNERFIMERIKAACANRNVNLIVYFPRAHCSYNVYHKANAQVALYLTRMGIPVLKDPFLGTWEDNLAFADTDLHLSVEGGRRFSSFLAKLIKEKQYWTEEELLHIINKT